MNSTAPENLTNPSKPARTKRTAKDRRVRIVAGMLLTVFTVLVIALFVSRSDQYMSPRAVPNMNTTLGGPSNAVSMPGMDMSGGASGTPTVDANAATPTPVTTSTPTSSMPRMDNTGGIAGMDTRAVDTRNAPIGSESSGSAPMS